jgi:hypothetical protein
MHGPMNVKDHNHVCRVIKGIGLVCKVEIFHCLWTAVLLIKKYLISTECKICALFVKFYKHVGFHKDCVWLHVEKDVDVSSYVSLDSELVICGICSMSEWSDERDLETGMNFAKAHSVYRTVTSFC